MVMAHEADAGFKIAEGAVAVLLGDEIVPLLGTARARVHAGRLADGRLQPEAREIFRVMRAELVSGPQRGRPRRAIEPVQVEKSERAVLVIARDDPGRPLSQ